MNSNAFIITPSYLIKKKRDHAVGIRTLSHLGLTVLNPEFPATLPSPKEKAEQIHRAFSDSNIDLILAQRGGYSAMKSLPFIDFDLIGNHPKVIAGFSDLCALLNPIYERTGLVTLHAPMVINLDKPTVFTVKSFLSALNGFPEKNLFRGAPVTVYHPGAATGVLKGGNLITLTALIDTDWEIDTIGAILFFEDVEEKLHQVDRYLTQWILAGKFKGVQGLILGDFRGIRNSRVFEILTSQMEVDFPVVHTPYVGHVKNKITLPVGAEVELNTQSKQLLLRESYVPGRRV